ncbi:DNA-binding transcriptional activator of the SARP family [Lentzea albidocapillata subsp. violacea]|uniref:DNA-binding transcriptional activator of the SARP family n=1 Tax=Lentzea albidocapillata subsp. violacea TaxID=128104 RepID=A0A1G8YFI2_9PSEU|nr:BTAD domain-containing putative transcriptional regulator [Lentzea albidocapillata]SDK01612.1 DNA-binding transcriptional activator of the SARP family [Lentzea albidocapillata subsp. violacea]
MIFHVLGPLEAHSSTGAVVDLGTRKAGTVLGVLLLHPNAWVRTDELISATWQEHAVPAAAKANLKTYVSQLRRTLPPFGEGNRIEARPGAYRLRVGRDELDSDRAAELAANARAAIEAGDHLVAAGLLEDALALWRGRPFEGLALDEACTAAGRLDDLRHDLEESLAGARLASGRPAEAIATLRELTRHDPLREGAWALLVRTLNAAGRRGEAVAAYREARAVLADELGVEPGPELAGALTDGAARPRREMPRDVPAFVGRARELALLRRFPDGAPVVIDGMSGVGKTALAVHAAHRLTDDFPDGQLFVNLRAGAVAVRDALARMLRGLGISDVPANVDEQAALWRSELAGRRVLLVLDDAGDARQVLPLLPGDGQTAVLITTRHRGWRLPGETRISLEPLGRNESTALLRQAAGHRVGADPAAVVRACGGLPSALLAAAARFLSRPSWTVAALASWCAEPGRLLDGLMSSHPLLDAGAQRAFRSIGGLPLEFDCALAAHHIGVGQQDARALLEELVDHHLLDAPAIGRYRSHPLVRELARRAVPAVVLAA